MRPKGHLIQHQKGAIAAGIWEQPEPKGDYGRPYHRHQQPCARCNPLRPLLLSHVTNEETKDQKC